MRFNDLLRTLIVLAVAASSLAADEITWVESGATWKYFRGQDEASAPSEAWRGTGFNDASWASGAAPFGYDDGPFGTDLSTFAPPMQGNYSSLFLRKTIDIANPGGVVQFEASVNYDDGFLLWINGVEVVRANMPGSPGDPIAFDDFASSNHESGAYESFPLPAPDGYLVPGTNVVAAMVFNNQINSSDLKFDLVLVDPIGVDTQPPVVATLVPAAGVTVRSMSQISVTFNETVVGVTAGDLLIGGVGASGVTGSGPGPYVFTFPPRSPGDVTVRWANVTGISDTADPSNAFAGGSWSYTVDPDAPSGELVINEILAANANGQRDEDQERPDWFEIVNVGSSVVQLDGWSVTDDPEEDGKWVLPARAIGPGEHLVIFASGKDRRPLAGNLHASFQLNAGGETVALYSPDSPRQLVDRVDFPLQRADVAYGRDGTGTFRYLQNPTPGAPNDTGSVLSGVIADPTFSATRGFYTGPFDLQITSSTPGTTIRYRLDGIDPTASSGTAYAAPIRIQGTTSKAVVTVKAIATRSGFLPSDVVTHTFIFPLLVPDQPDQPAGFPTSWGGGAPAVDYGMDPQIVDVAAYRDRIVPALLAVPTVSFVMDTNDMFGSSGIYSNPGSSGVSWERPVSVEFIYPDGEDGVQINCGVRIQGGASRTPSKSPKHSFRLLFKGDYGPTKLEHEVFGDTPVDRFDQLILRAGYNNSWVHWDSGQRSRSQYIRDQWVRDTIRDMGRISSHGNYVHLYINGLYWGLYNLVERPNAAFAASYAGGDKDEYDALNSGNAVDGNTAAYSTMMGIAEGGLSTTAAYLDLQQYLDVPLLADYMIANFFGANDDWPSHNWYAARRRAPGAGYMYLSWDAERIFESVNNNRVGADAGNSPGRVFQRLRDNAEFRLLVADRVHEHFFNGGALTTQAVIDRWEARAEQIEEAVVGEAARWGDYRRDVHPSSNGPYEFYTPVTHWEPERSRLRTSYFPQRSGVVLSQLTSAGLYPSVGAPELNQHGGAIDPGFAMTLRRPTGTSGTIYFTTDGEDPRVFDSGAVSGSASAYSAPVTLLSPTLVRARIRNGTTWSALTEALFTMPDAYSALEISEVMYHALGGREFEWVELRNTGGASLALAGLRFTDGIDYEFDGGSLDGGAFLVLAADAAAFASRYPGVDVHGEYAGTLDNGGERLTLVDRGGATLASFRYDDEDGWPVAADGFGRSLVFAGGGRNPDEPSSWASSAELHGFPGGANPLPLVGGVVISEVLSRSSAPYEDAIELLNVTGAPIDVSGWFLSDDRDDATSLKKFRIPDGTVIPAGGHVAFYESEFNASPGSEGSFALDGSGESVFLSAAHAPTGTLEGYTTELEFEASEENVSLGVVATSRDLDVTALAEPSFGVSNPANVAAFRLGDGAPNGAALVGPLVIHEIQYNPAPGAPEFVELYNTTGQAVPLWDAALGRGWRLTGVSNASGTDSFEFGPGHEVPPFGYLVVAPVSADLFRLVTNVPAEAVVVGPSGGSLDNGGERLRLMMPVPPDGDEDVPYVVIDRIVYDDVLPWPATADGTGRSLERRIPEDYGNDPANWGASQPLGGTPGAQNSVGPPPPNRPPTARFTMNPPFGPAPLDVTFNASTSSDPEGEIASYEWTFGDGTSDSGRIVGHTYDDEGQYEVELVVADPEGLTSSFRQTVTVAENVPPVASFTMSAQQGVVPFPVDLDARASDDPDGSIVAYRWDFGDGGQATGERVSHIYNRTGEFEVVLTVEDDAGETGESRRTITVLENVRPEARFTATPPSGAAPLRVTFDGSASRDPDGEIVSYSWDFGNGAQGGGVTTSLTYQSPGSYNVTLAVEDQFGLVGIAMETVVVLDPGANAPPVARMTITPDRGPAPLEVTFDGRASADPDGRITRYTWDFGNGVQEQGALVTYTYTQEGTYQVIFSVTDELDASAALIGAVTVTSAGGERLPGDCNEDGNLNISDAQCLLGHLFLGSPLVLPCDGGTKEDAGNLTLLDASGDRSVDVSDAIRVLGYLFQGGLPPALGTECVPMIGCSSRCP